MAIYFCERFYSKSWLCLCLLFFICVSVNMMVFFGSLSMYPFKFLKIPRLSATPPVPALEIDNHTIPLGKLEDLKAVTSHSEVKPAILNPHNFKYLINEEDLCAPKYELIIVICTAVKNVKERDAIRQTWGSKDLLEKNNTKLIFLLGNVNSEKVLKNLKNESDHYHDIVQEDFVDSYRNLSLKSVALLRWVCNYCLSAKYILKADDDMYVNVPNLLQALKKISYPKFILGYVFEGAKPIQDKKSKWHTPPKEFNEKVYPRYVSGTTYAMSTNCAPDLFKAALQMKLFWLEDVYITGLLARKVGIPRLHEYRFSYMKLPATGCAFTKVITGHNYTIKELFKIHQELHSKNLNCKK